MLFCNDFPHPTVCAYQLQTGLVLPDVLLSSKNSKTKNLSEHSWREMILWGLYPIGVYRADQPCRRRCMRAIWVFSFSLPIFPPARWTGPLSHFSFLEGKGEGGHQVGGWSGKPYRTTARLVCPEHANRIQSPENKAESGSFSGCNPLVVVGETVQKRTLA
jgi:hypothetical protein